MKYIKRLINLIIWPILAILLVVCIIPMYILFGTDKSEEIIESVIEWFVNQLDKIDDGN